MSEYRVLIQLLRPDDTSELTVTHYYKDKTAALFAIQDANTAAEVWEVTEE